MEESLSGNIPKLTGNKYLVTGAAGFIGSHIAEEIARQGRHVVCVDSLTAGNKKNFSPWWNPKLCTFVRADIRSHDFIKYMRDVDVVFHNAASKCTVCRDDPIKDLMVNAWGSFNVFEAAQYVGAKVVHASTGSVFNGEPKSFYGVSKQAGECYLRAFKEYYPNFRFSVIRYHHVYGPRQDSSDRGGVIPIFIRNILKGEPIQIHGDGTQERLFTYVKDVVAVNIIAAEHDAFNGAFIDFANPQKTKIGSLPQILSILMEPKNSVKIEHAPERPGDIKKFLLGNWWKADYFKFTDLSEGLIDTIRYYQNAITQTLAISGRKNGVDEPKVQHLPGT